MRPERRHEPRAIPALRAPRRDAFTQASRRSGSPTGAGAAAAGAVVGLATADGEAEAEAAAAADGDAAQEHLLLNRT